MKISVHKFSFVMLLLPHTHTHTHNNITENPFYAIPKKVKEESMGPITSSKYKIGLRKLPKRTKKHKGEIALRIFQVKQTRTCDVSYTRAINYWLGEGEGVGAKESGDMIFG